MSTIPINAHLSHTTLSQTRLLHLLHLSSAALPVGGYSFSQGLEYAIEVQWVDDANSLEQWLLLQLNEGLKCVDVPLLTRLMDAAKNEDYQQFQYWNAMTLACRETAELRFGDIAMGNALVKLLESLDIPFPYETQQKSCFVSGFAAACQHWGMNSHDACYGYVWAWLENQVAAALKLMPLGQTQAQKLLNKIIFHIPEIIHEGLDISDEGIGVSLPAVAMASTLHETQYTRIFRS